MHSGIRRTMVVMLLLLVSVIGCTWVAAKNEKVTITGMVATSQWNPGMDAIVKAIANKTGVTLDIQKLPEGNQGEQVIKTKLAINDMTDLLFYHSGASLRLLSPERNFVDLSKESYTKSMFDVLRAPLSPGGVTYGVPFTAYGINIGGIFYNKKVFKDLKLKVPQTWDEMLAVCEKIKAAGKIPVYYAMKDAWTTQLFHLESIPYVENSTPQFVDRLNSNKLKLADVPGYIQGLSRAKEICDKGFINEDYLSATYDNAQKALVNGDATMFPMGSWIMSQLETNYPDKIKDIGAFAMPAPKGQPWVTVWAGGGIYISKHSKNIAATKKWLAAYATPDIQAIYHKQYKVLPSFKGVEADLYPAFSDLVKYMDAKRSTLALEFQAVVGFNDLEKVTSDVIIGSRTAKEAAQYLDSEFEQAAKAKNIPGF